MPSADPARRRVFVIRYMRRGHGDEFSARDAMSAARAAMTSVKDMHRGHYLGCLSEVAGQPLEGLSGTSGK
ncbi:hypothetical protein [Nonomuraea basaltis]|uniref:hypothetical protein n=1 Tax=Nonomuraea basaltis TaxID=2495887 RepID=UPI00110C68A5|nr:hypothetical protein [Nonomuraea basaltis]TMR97942.1 hypothetical protein EJK15_15710 [Nonomuraea basaltis]